MLMYEAATTNTDNVNKDRTITHGSLVTQLWIVCNTWRHNPMVNTMSTNSTKRIFYLPKKLASLISVVVLQCPQNLDSWSYALSRHTVSWSEIGNDFLLIGDWGSTELSWSLSSEIKKAWF
jgi:hypothetical protein